MAWGEAVLLSLARAACACVSVSHTDTTRRSGVPLPLPLPLPLSLPLPLPLPPPPLGKVGEACRPRRLSCRRRWWRRDAGDAPSHADPPSPANRDEVGVEASNSAAAPAGLLASALPTTEAMFPPRRDCGCCCRSVMMRMRDWDRRGCRDEPLWPPLPTLPLPLPPPPLLAAPTRTGL